MNKYEDIINLEYKPKNKMSIKMRSAQFLPFSALSGYSDKINETGRIIENKKDLDEDIKNKIDNKLQKIFKDIKNKPKITITYFIKDSKKNGGKYVTEEIKINKINMIEKYLNTEDNKKIYFENILDIKQIEK